MRIRTHLLSRLFGAGCLIAAGWLLAQAHPLALAQPPANRGLATPTETEKNIVAYVNGVPITRQELGEDLIARRGARRLELLINRKIIEQAAQKAGITVTDTEVEADLKDFIQASGCSNARDFEKNVLNRGRDLRDLNYTTLFEYKEDVSKPAILMRKLGGERVQITDEELKKAFDSKYGQKVQCRVILERDFRSAERVYHEILAAAGKGEKSALLNAFLAKARVQADPRLAATAGLIHVSHHSSYDNVEQRAFQLGDQQMSEILQTPEGHLILLREKLVPAEKSKKFDDEKESLRKEFAENKLRVEVPKLFKELRKQAVVQDYLNNKQDIKAIMEEFSSTYPGR